MLFLWFAGLKLGVAKRIVLAVRREEFSCGSYRGASWEAAQSRSSPDKWLLREEVAERSGASAKRYLQVAMVPQYLDMWKQVIKDCGMDTVQEFIRFYQGSTMDGMLNWGDTADAEIAAVQAEVDQEVATQIKQVEEKLSVDKASRMTEAKERLDQALAQQIKDASSSASFDLKKRGLHLSKAKAKLHKEAEDKIKEGRDTIIADSKQAWHGPTDTGSNPVESGNVRGYEPTATDQQECREVCRKFTGASGTWDSWWYKFKTWVESCHKNAVKIVAHVEAQCDKEITEPSLEVDFDEGAELVSVQARQALISLTEGEALEIVKKLLELSAANVSRPNKLQDYLDLQASRLTSYDQVKAEVLAYLENVEARKEAKSGAVPMDVDSLAKGKGKGKHDKGKGKGKSKGKDKGKNQSSSWSNNSYNKGSWNQQSWNQQSWCKQGSNDAKSKGKGKKGQDKGKGKGDQGKGRKVASVEPDAWAQEQPAATTPGEPELTALFTLEETMPTKSETPKSEEPRRGRSPRRANLQPPSRGTVTRRAEGRAASAPAPMPRRLRADLEAGAHPRAAKKAEKDRQRAASHRASTGQARAADWKGHELAVHGQAQPEKWDKEDKGDEPEPPQERNLEPKRHRGGHLR
eukprot:s2981_g4.t1